ncbi:MAG: hypothetical protein NWQ21_07525 [Desulfobacterales bacterium]|nr:hypothetical protein [Desulfobacterales bacterium]
MYFPTGKGFIVLQVMPKPSLLLGNQKGGLHLEDQEGEDYGAKPPSAMAADVIFRIYSVPGKLKSKIGKQVKS